MDETSFSGSENLHTLHFQSFGVFFASKIYLLKTEFQKSTKMFHKKYQSLSNILHSDTQTLSLIPSVIDGYGSA